MGNAGSLQILVVEDNAKVRNVICHLLRRAGYAVDAAGDGPSAIDKLRQRYFDLVITDYKMDRMDGLEVLQQVKRNWPGTQVIIITAFGSIPSGVEAIKLGAVDYLTKPFDNQELLRLVERFVEKKRAQREVKDLLGRLRKKTEFDAIIGESPKLLRVFDTVCQVAETDSTIMIYGESGTGKELIARAIHDMSRRKEKPFVPVNCAAIPENLQDSELFGHVKGAFTGATTDRKGLFEVADGGTVFLDEIAETALSTQVKLLRVLQESELRRVGDGITRKVDIRLIAATNKDLEADVKRGAFREDLFYRINVIPIRVPPLRERKGDIELLTEYLVAKYSSKMRKTVNTVSKRALAMMMNYEWPGNVRELENVIQRAVALAATNEIGPDLLPSELSSQFNPAGHSKTKAARLAQVERETILKTLEQMHGNKKRTAEVLGISKATLWRKLKYISDESEEVH